VNEPVVDPAGIVAGVIPDIVAVWVALLARVTAVPPVGAGLARVTVPVTVLPTPIFVNGKDKVTVRRLTFRFVVPSVNPVAKPVRTDDPLTAAVVTVNAAVIAPIGMQTLVAGFAAVVEITPIEGMLKARLITCPAQLRSDPCVAAAEICTLPVVEANVSRLPEASDTLTVPDASGLEFASAMAPGDVPVG
jgi:hypothetical protein